jgi:hypothetical protein
MDKIVDYKEVPIGDKNYWEVDRDLVQGVVGNEISWNIEYKPVCDVEGKIAGWWPKAAVYARGGRDEVVLMDVGVNYVIKADKDGNVYIDYLKPVEKRGLYDLYIDNHMDIPDTISKDSPCYKQFMKERERM